MPANGTTLIPFIVDLQGGSDSNGGTSETILATATDGATAAGNSTLTSASASFTSALIGHGVTIGANWRLVSAVADATHLTYSGASLGTLSAQTYIIGGASRTINRVASLSGAPLVSGDVVAIAPSPLHYREAVTLGQSGVAVGGAITAVSTAVPAVVTTTSAHGLLVGQYVWISGLVGNPELNGFHKVTAVGSTTTYSIDNSAAGSAWISGGVTEQLIAIVGDVDGYWTGKTGDVTVSGYSVGDLGTPGVNAPWVINGKSGWVWVNILSIAGAQRAINGTTAGSQYLAWVGGAITGGPPAGNDLIDLQGTADTAMHVVFDRCHTHNAYGAANLGITAPSTAAAADYDLDITIQNCRWVGTVAAPLIDLIGSGSQTHQAGGVVVRNNTLIGAQTAVRSNDAHWSVTIPCRVFNNAIVGMSASQALRSLTTTGNIFEDYNAIDAQSPRSSVTAGSTSLTVLATLIEIGQAIGTSRAIREFGAPSLGSPLLGFGNSEIAVSGGAATITDDATVGTIAWSNPGNASYPEGTNATNIITLGADSHYLNFQGFGFNIPGNATIDGVRIELLRSAANAGDLAINGGSSGVKLLDAGVISGRNHTDTTTFGTGLTYEIFGGHCDLWGVALTPAKVNAAGFGFVVSVHGTVASTANIDYARMVVYYHFATPVFALDGVNRPRPSGAYSTLYSGTATSGGNATLTDTGQLWGTNQLAGVMLAITGGTGSGQRKLIKSNTGNVITAYSNWATNPDNTSTYTVYLASGGICETGKATSGSATQLTVSNASWQASQWVGFTGEITGGTGSGQLFAIIASSATTITVGPETGAQFVTNPDSTSTFSIYRGVGGVSAVQNAAGAFERHDNQVIEHTTVDVDPAARIDGPGDFDLRIAVDASATAPAIKYRSSANATPSIQVLANAECGVVDQAAQTGTASQGTFTVLTSPSFTPTKQSVVRMRCMSNATTPIAQAFYDTAVAG